MITANKNKNVQIEDDLNATETNDVLGLKNFGTGNNKTLISTTVINHDTPVRSLRE